MLLTQNLLGISASHISSNKHAKCDSNMLIEKDEVLLKSKKIADVLNSYLDSITMHSKTFWKGFTIMRL